MVDRSLYDPSNNSYFSISKNGELIIRQYGYSEPYYQQITSASPSSPVQVVAGKSNHNFIITDIVFATTKSWGSASAAYYVTLYSANPADITEASKIKTLMQADLLQNDRFIMDSLMLKVGDSLSVIALAEDGATGTADVTILGYYIPVDNGN